jgi:deazaflavin-dependent oxidoreductase (nitroreductase family)
MVATATRLYSVVRVLGVLLVLLGLLFWAGWAYALVPLHVALGYIFVVGLWAVAGLAGRMKGSPFIVGPAVVWGLGVILLGLHQQELLPGEYHWVVRVLHLVVGFTAVIIAGLLVSGIIAQARPFARSPKAFRVTPTLRLGNFIVATLLRLGVRIGPFALLTVQGRKSGRPRTTPVAIGEWNGQRWVLSPYGEVDWVRNLRAAGHGTLTRGRHVEPFNAVELSTSAAAPILKQALVMMPAFLRSYFEVTASSTSEELEREAVRHPIFQLQLPTSGASEGVTSSLRPAR